MCGRGAGSKPAQNEEDQGKPEMSKAFPSLAPVLARAAHCAFALTIAGEPLNDRKHDIDRAAGWLDLGSRQAPDAVPLAAIAATGLGALQRSSLLADAIGPSRQTPRVYVGPRLDPSMSDEPGLLHLDLTGVCRSNHAHTTWDPVSQDCGEVLLTAQTLADAAADPDAAWAPAPKCAPRDANNQRTLEVMTIIGAALWAAASEGWDLETAIEQFSQTYFPSVLSSCRNMSAQTGMGVKLCTTLEAFAKIPQGVLGSTLHEALDPLCGMIRAAKGGRETVRLDLVAWLSGSSLLAITIPGEPTSPQLAAVNAMLGAADGLGRRRRNCLPPTVVWEGVPSPRHGAPMARPLWLGIFDDASQFLIWSELLNAQTPQHGCDWLIGAGAPQWLLARLAQDTTPPSGDQRVLLDADKGNFMLLE